MACFIVPAGEAIITTVAEKVIEKNSDKNPVLANIAGSLKYLNGMLWGGSALLMFEHVWHGEVVPFFPFLTAMNDPADTAEMLSEMGSVGVTMAILVTAVWAIGVGVATAIKRRPVKEATT
ncbi:MAG: hypothetical protein II782_03035 [Oscillospiraceae bacterium]|nr:hypothetical protein [Oscillospiraceae bacterium]